MSSVVLRVRLTSGDQIDVTFERDEVTDAEDLVAHVIDTLATESGVLRCRHGDRLVVLFGRGVASVEVAPRGAIL